jgi:dihydropteroate synthase
MIFRAQQHTFTFPRPIMVMGILNVTPDSFSDGGRFMNPELALERAEQMIAEGADLLDIGGESTRPKAVPVTEDEEIRRVVPVVERLAGRNKVPISIDTMKPGVARRALEAGACIVNDIAANVSAPEMWEVIAAAKAGYVLMHMQGTPQTMQEKPSYTDVVAEVGAFFDEKLRCLQEAGIAAEQVVLDVGIGFGKTAEHNLRLLASLGKFTRWNRPLLLGVSRKSFIGRVTAQSEATARLPGSLACACWTAREGVNIVRTHDVAATRQALRMTEAIIAQTDE